MTLELWMLAVLAILTATFAIILHTRGVRLGQRKSIENIATVTRITNAILQAWFWHATRENNIPGLPVEVEMKWLNAEFTSLECAVIRVRYSYYGASYQVTTLQPHLDTRDQAAWHVAAFTFEPIKE